MRVTAEELQALHDIIESQEKQLKLADDMASYVGDTEQEDYFDQCKEKEIYPYLIIVSQMFHIYQTYIYYQYLRCPEVLENRWVIDQVTGEHQ